MNRNEQLGLFAPDRVVLAQDAEGGIVYRPGLVDPALAAVWFEALRSGVDWRSERRRMYEREVDVPRLTAHYRLDAALPDALTEAARIVRAATEVPFNSVGLNLYRDGRDSVAPHNDHLDEIVPGYPIALLSLGGARRMTIREKAPPRRAVHVELEPGSLLTMSHASQLSHLHGIPKEKAPRGPRISLAFRVRTPEGLDGY